MPTMEPGMIRFGAEDIERIEMVLWFKELGPSEIRLSFGQDGADAEAEATLRDTLFTVFKDVLTDCAAKGTVEISAYDPDAAVEAVV
jgi:hypothetical protein